MFSTQKVVWKCESFSGFVCGVGWGRVGGWMVGFGGASFEQCCLSLVSRLEQREL